MESKPRSSAAPPMAILLLSVIPAVLLARCGLWPTFPDRDGGISLDASDGGMFDGRTDSSLPMIDARDTAADVGADSSFGFMTCTTRPTTGPFALTVVATVPNNTRHIAFDGRAAFVTASMSLDSFDTSGTETVLPNSALGFSGRGLHFLPTGEIAVVTTEQSLRVYSPSDAGVSVAASGFSYLNDVTVDSSGAMYFSDTALSGAMPAVRRATLSSAMVTTVTTGVPVPTGLVFTPDFHRLFIGSAAHGVYYVDLAADGTATGMPHVYLNEPANAFGLAFDECGYLYVTDADRGRILRVPPGGGSFETLMFTLPDGGSITPVGLAFGQAPFDRTSLYFVDVSSDTVYRMPVNVRGAAVVLPR